MKEPIIPPTELKLIPVIEILARKLMAMLDEPDPNSDLVDLYCGQVTEDLSIAGFTETTADQQRSSRAFTNLLRIDSKELRRVKGALGLARGRSFDELALSNVITEAISGQRVFQEVLARICSTEKPVGPFSPNCRELELLPALPQLAEEAAGAPVSKKDQLKSYVAHVIKTFEAPHYFSAPLMQFAGLIRVAPKDLKKVAAEVRKHTELNSWQQQEVLAEVIVNVLRITPRFRQGIKWSQFDIDNTEVESTTQAE